MLLTSDKLRDLRLRLRGTRTAKVDKCVGCQQRLQCPVAHLSPCKRRRAFAGDPAYELPDFCPHNKERKEP